MRGYYCIIQYAPNRERAEGANVGVLLYSPEHKFIDAMLSSSNDRVCCFFGPDGGLDLKRSVLLKSRSASDCVLRQTAFKTLRALSTSWKPERRT